MLLFFHYILHRHINHVSFIMTPFPFMVHAVSLAWPAGTAKRNRGIIKIYSFVFMLKTGISNCSEKGQLYGRVF